MKWNKVKWSNVISPKKFEGLNIKKARPYYNVLPVELDWNLLYDPHEL